MTILPRFAAFLSISAQLLAGGPLSQASVKPLALGGNDLVYDPARDVFYVSVPSSAGFPYGNSVVTIDPVTGEVTHAAFVGSEPNKLAISADGARVYVGVDGAYSFCWWEPGTDNVSALVNFTSNFAFGPYVVDDFAVDPSDAHVVAVSKNDVRSSAAGAVELFRDSQSLVDLGQIYGAESIAFSSPDTLVGYNNYTTGFELFRWAFDGKSLTQTGVAGNVVSGFGVRIKAANGLVFSDNGKVASVATLSALGTFSGLPGSPAVEPDLDQKRAYFLGSSVVDGVGMQLVAFDTKNFLKLDSVVFAKTPSGPVRSLVKAGTGLSGEPRLGFIRSDGSGGVISIPPPVFKVEQFQSNGAISQLTWSSQIGHQYRLQWSSDLRNWSTFITMTATRFDSSRTFAPQSNGPEREYYRVVTD